MEDLPRQFGRYELLELIATGGMAQIYLARLASTVPDQSGLSSGQTAKELVIKRIMPHLIENREFFEMFVDEARITMPLHHGNVVQVYEFGQVGSDYFLAMEYVRGRNLETVQSRLAELERPVPVEVALFVGSEVAKGLDYAHRFRDPQDRPTGIIHRDVSPQNILVGYQGEVKLTDFGIAKARSRIRQTAQGIIRGKACYLSPEQAECRELDGRSDQFSLGTVVYEMLCGLRPFEAEHEVATLQRVREAKVDPPSTRRRGLPAEVDRAVMRALQREPDARFADCAAFGLALARPLQSIAPEFTSASLADWMRGLFAREIGQEVAARTTKERMLEQLARQGARVDASMSTGELLKMGTLTMRSGSQPTGAAGSGKRRLGWLLAGALVLVLAAGTWLAWPALRESLGLDGSANPSLPDAGVSAADGEDAGTDAGHGPEGAGDGEASSDTDAADATDATDVADASHSSRADAGQEGGADRRRRILYGYLRINSDPWAYVELDGRRLPGETPIMELRVRAGRHRLRFFNPELKIEKSMTVHVHAKRTETISVKLKP
ncbi:MAG: protein kinase [Deltaproteobacteria bacterium]|nr:protein kinase [Deltaproteobacteria bacterium]